jgi:hypothetical protein
MRFLTSNVVIATWLLLSAFMLPHSAFTQATTWAAAVLIGAAALMAPGRPAARYVVSLLALALAGIALLAPGISASAAINNALVAAVLFALSLVNPAPKAVTVAGGG